MKTILICCILILICHFDAINAAKEYTNKFDNIDVDSILNNNRILTNYIKCLMDKGPCTAEGRELKRLLPDALQTDCSKCTSVQQRNSRKVIQHLRTNRANDWKLLVQKYDPKGVHRARLDG